MPSILEQATIALQRGQYAAAAALVQETLGTPEALSTRLPLLQILAQAQEGLHDYATAAHTWQQAYTDAITCADKARLFERLTRIYQSTQAYAPLFHLTQQQLAYVNTVQERATCLLTAGEALLHLRRYRQARCNYLEPAVRLPDVAAETRVYLWHNLGLSHLAEHTFETAAAAFQQSAELVLGIYYARRAAHAAAPPPQLHHLRNLAYFYEGVIHLLYRRPQQAIPALQRLQRPLTAMGALTSMLYLALAQRHMQQPEAAERSIQPLLRAPEFPEMLKGPAAVICAGIANLRHTFAAVATHLEVVLDASLLPRTSWEPSWRALLYQELGLALQYIGYRKAAIACYEGGLKIVVQRAGVWPDSRYSNWLRGPSLLTALANLPLHAWSATIRGELVGLLQKLAWLYGPLHDCAQADAALALALRLATTPEQQVYLWSQRGWLAAIMPCRQDGNNVVAARAEVLLGIQQARARCTPASLAQFLRGIEALLQQNTPLAQACFDQVPTIPEAPEVQALGVAAWLWAQATQDTLAESLRAHQSTVPPPWRTADTLASALEMLLAWSTAVEARTPPALVAWLGPVLAHLGPDVWPTLRRWCCADYLPTAQHTALLAALDVFAASPAYEALADQAVEILGGHALQQRIAALLTRIDQYVMPLAQAPHPGARRRRHRQHQTPALSPRLPDLEGVLRLIHLLEHTGTPTADAQLPATIQAWLVCYPRLGVHAPEVVSALLGLLRQCPTASTVMRSILQQVALSQRQRHGLETALQHPLSPPATVAAALAWEPMRHWSLAQLLTDLQHIRPQPVEQPDSTQAARQWYMLALLLSRLGLLSSAADCLHACLRRLPESPLASFMLGQVLRLQQQYSAALQATQQAWHTLSAQAPQPHILHFEVLNQLLMLLGVLHRYDQFPPWLATFERLSTTMADTVLSTTHQQRWQEEAGEFALSQALYLAATPLSQQTPADLEQQLRLLAQAIAQGTRSTQHFALHRQAETLVRLQRHDEAAAVYARVSQQWPEDHDARFRLALLTAVLQATIDVTVADQAFAEALSLACAAANIPPALRTAPAALQWLQQAPAQAPGYAEVTDALTAYAGMALKRQEFTAAIALLTPLYACTAQPRQAYYLAQAHQARSQQVTSVTEQWCDCEHALQYAQQTMESGLYRPLARALLPQLQAQYQRLTAARHHEAALADYRTRVHNLFKRYTIPVQEETVDQTPDASWLTVHELIELDEASGNPTVTVRLYFPHHPGSTTPQPSEQEMELYAQHQRDMQRVVATHGIGSLPWPQTAYTGNTAFALIFPERLALNRALVFLVHAEPKALLRYAQALLLVTQGLIPLVTATSPPPVSLVITAARYITIFPLLRQRLQVLAMGLSAKARQHQLRASQAVESTLSLAASLQTIPAFLDAQAYFQAIAGAMRSLLDTPPATTLRASDETDVLTRRTHQRRSKTPRPDKRLQQFPPLPVHIPPPGARDRESQG